MVKRLDKLNEYKLVPRSGVPTGGGFGGLFGENRSNGVTVPVRHAFCPPEAGLAENGAPSR